MMNQKQFDSYRKKNQLPTYPLGKGQLIMLADSGLPCLFKTAKEREQAWANTSVKPMPKFLDVKVEDESTRRFRRFMEIESQRKKDISLNSLKVRGLKAKAEKKSVPKPVLGQGIRIKVVNKQPRAPGTGAGKRYAEMVAYVKTHPKADAAEVIAKTTYRNDDYKWDLAHGNIKGEPI